MSLAAITPLAALASLACCAQPSPFVDLGPLTDDDIVRILRERTEVADTLEAELVISYDSPELSGTFDAIAHFRRPGSMRIFAFKDLLFSVEPIFDLLLTPEEYALELRAERDGPLELHRGAARDLPRAHPQFRGFFFGREAFCLPGTLARQPAATVLPSGGDEVTVEGRLPSGAAVRWTVARSTLEVRAGSVEISPGHVATFRYSEYIGVDGVFVPGRIVFEDPEHETRIEAQVAELTVGPDVDSTVLFSPASYR